MVTSEQHKESEIFRSRMMRDTIKDIEKNISSCDLGEGIIKKAFNLGWSLREYQFHDLIFTSEEANEIYSLDKKIRENCKCSKS